MGRILVRPLAIVLVFQQIGLARPALALGNAQLGKPLDASALAEANHSPLGVEASLFTGAASMRVPIVAPPATGGLTPSVALVYSSDASQKSGEVGAGWSLEVGFPKVIERSTRNGAPAYDSSDAYELAGARLKRAAAAGRYVAEDHDFQRIEQIASGADGHWRVLRPDGTRLYYGYEDDGISNESILRNIRVNSLEPTVATCPNGPWGSPCGGTHETIIEGLTAFAWYLDRVEDRNGNVTKLTWGSLGDRGMRYLLEVSYSGHLGGAADALPDFGGSDGGLARSRVITFSYDVVKPDQLPTYRTGFPQEIRRALSDVHVSVGGALVRHYLFEYATSPASGRSLLTTVRERGADDAAATELVQSFAYGDGGDPGASFWSAKNSTWALPAGLTFVDAGRDRGIRLVDVNSDGHPDVLRGRSGVRRAYLGGPNGFSGTSISAFAPPIDLANNNGFTGAVFGDFDGDGRPDLMRRFLNLTGTAKLNRTCSTSGSSGVSRHRNIGTFTSQTWRNTGSGWVVDSDQDPPVFAFDTYDQATVGDADSCPDEHLNTGSALSGVNAGYDQAARVIDIDGDGRDDLAYKTGLGGIHNEFQRAWIVDEIRAGTLLNGPAGLRYGTFNNAHDGTAVAIQGSSTVIDVDFLKVYDRPRWQVPLFTPEGVAWSTLNTCKASQNTVAEAHSGMERMADLNGDGLPEIFEAIYWAPCLYSCGSIQTIRTAYVNNGYGWKVPDLFNEEFDIYPIDVHYAIVPAEQRLSIGSSWSTCTVGTDPGSGLPESGLLYDYGVRIVDFNGDGGPDYIGGWWDPWLARKWTAANPVVPFVHEAASAADPRWRVPIAFFVDASQQDQDTGVRLADVNADGLVDILVADGAYLNLARVPDKLESVTSPHGAVTTIVYEPHTVFDGPLETTYPTVDGQRRHAHPRWVATEIRVDPGPAFGQPVMTRRFEYYDPVYDVDDRAFRGFGNAVVRESAVSGVERVTDVLFHVSDALRGRPYDVSVSSFDTGTSASTLLRRTLTEYAHASGNGSATVTYPDGSTAPLASVDPATQADAFGPFAGLMAGSPEAGEAFLAVGIARETEEVEGSATPFVSRVETSFDVYGNATQVRALGDPADPRDDITTTTQYVQVDGVVGGKQVLLANLPQQIDRVGVQGDLPAGTTLARSATILYDHLPAPGTALRGNPTAVDRPWTDPQAGLVTVRVERSYDAYGNEVEISSPFDAGSPAGKTLLGTAYDPVFQTFPVQVSVSSPEEPEADLVATLSYEAPGCGAPPGLGLVCEVIDPNLQASSWSYDALARRVGSTGPNGAETAIDYHDADRGSASQRTEIRLRWDPTGPAVAGDPDALVLELFYDGLGRVLAETRPGLGADVGRRTIAYDAAGRIASATRWSYGPAPGPATLFAHDALGRLARVTLPDTSYMTRSYGPRRVEIQIHEAVEGLVQRRIERSDAFGRLAAVDEFADPLGSAATTTYLYDPFGQLAVVDDAVANDPGLCPPGGAGAACPTQRHQTRLLYDELGNRTELFDPDSGTWRREHDARQLVVVEEDPRGIRQELEYDGLGRIRRRHAVYPPELPDPGEPDDVFTYGLVGTAVPHGLGRLIRIEDAEGRDELEYDAAGHVAFHRRTVAGLRFDFSHTYDPLGRRIETANPDGETITWHYDRRLLGRISTTGAVGAPGGPGFVGDLVGGVAYDAEDQVTRVELGGSGGSALATEVRSYDPTTGQLDRILAESAGRTLADLDYGLDGLGRVRTLASQTAPIGASGGWSPGTQPPLEARSFGYGYDGLGRLLEATGLDLPRFRRHLLYAARSGTS